MHTRLLSPLLAALVIGNSSAHRIADTPQASDQPSPSTVLLVTAPELAEAWKPFASWKRKLGKPVTILTTDQIAANFEGPDLQEKIRRCVRKHIDEKGTRWVVLGGDSEPNGKGLVPDRDTVHRTMWGENTKIPTDIYYLSPTNWDADQDGIYGEWKEDREAITYPDGKVGLGRIPVRTASDVKAYTDKVIAYESQYPEKDFATNMTYTCTVPGAYAKVRRSWDDHVSKSLQGGTVARFFSDETPWDEEKAGDYPLSPENWMKLINEKKTGKLHIHGHGFLPCWVLENDQLVTADHVAKLTNKNAYPVITTVSCFTGQFDARKDPSIAESMLRQPNAGAVLLVAPCREGKPHFVHPQRDFPLMVRDGKLDGTTKTMTQFWANGTGNNLTAGESMMTTKAGMKENALKSANFHMCLCELNLLGDPTLHLRSDNPRRPSLEVQNKAAEGKGTLLVTTDTPGATVTISGGKQVYEAATTDAEGKVSFTLESVLSHPLEVTVSGRGLNAVGKTIEASN